MSTPTGPSAQSGVQRDVISRLGRPFGNYAYFAGLVENWFLDPAIMTLDEYGVPIQVGVKLEQVLQPEDNLDTALDRARLPVPQINAVAPNAFTALRSAPRSSNRRRPAVSER
jgi:hypothetical protein